MPYFATLIIHAGGNFEQLDEVSYRITHASKMEGKKNMNKSDMTPPEYVSRQRVSPRRGGSKLHVKDISAPKRG